MDRLDLPRRPRPISGTSAIGTSARTPRRAARKAFAANPNLSVRELAGKVAMAAKHTISYSTAQALMGIVRDEAWAKDQARARDEREMTRAHVTSEVDIEV